MGNFSGAMEFEPVIGLEVHAELETRSKMFCSCPVVDSTLAEPNVAVCPVCTGMPGVLPVVNRSAVEYALRVAVALECEIALTSIFARKNYFYPDLPKGYQISQYEQPLARHGRLSILTAEGERVIRIRRVHLEEDTGKLTHVSVVPEQPVETRDPEIRFSSPRMAPGASPGAGSGAAEGENGVAYSLVDLNRAGIPLLEIVTEPDLKSAEEVRAFASALRSLLRYLGVNSGDLEKGVLRVEPNVSVRPVGTNRFGTRVEIKNLNSFRALERSVAYEIERQIAVIKQGQPVRQETVGWDDDVEVTFTQRVKEGEDDYRYFPEPDLPPLVVEPEWIERVRNALPELPHAKFHRLRQQYGLNEYDARVLVAEVAVADYFERVVSALENDLPVPAARVNASGAKSVANWITGELFGLLNQTGASIEFARIPPEALADLVRLVSRGDLNVNTAKSVLAEMFTTGKPAEAIVRERGWRQISDPEIIAGLVEQVLADHPGQVQEYLRGKTSIARWLFGQVMRSALRQANPQMVQQELQRQLEQFRESNTGP
jgi:aspartyl-tRNA(Asn)/glutamyl-tRNA(Gln) amidotransferase subunit B